MRRYLIVSALAAAILIPSGGHSGPVCDAINDGDYTGCYWFPDHYGVLVSVPYANVNVGADQSNEGGADTAHFTEARVCHNAVGCTRVWFIDQDCYALIVLGDVQDCSAVVLPAPIPYLGPYIP